MAAAPFVLSHLQNNAQPSRTLRDGISVMAVMAESLADARAIAKAEFGSDLNDTWANASQVTPAAAADMNGWALRLRIVSPLGVEVFDEIVEADGTDEDFVAATGTLTLTPGAIADDVVRVGDYYYKFAADPTTGTPTGLVGSPFLVDVGGTDTISLANLRAAINNTGTPGTTYCDEINTITPDGNPLVEATASNATTLSAEARTAGSAGNTISTTVTTAGGADGLAWGAVTLTGGVGATDQVSSLALKMVAALNASADIAGAAWNNGTQVLTIAETTDVLGDHEVYIYFIPADADRTQLQGVATFVTDLTDSGVAADALEAVFETDAYEIPKLIGLFGEVVL